MWYVTILHTPVVRYVNAEWNVAMEKSAVGETSLPVLKLRFVKSYKTLKPLYNIVQFCAENKT